MNLQLIHYINIVTKGKWNHFEMAHYIVRAEYQADKTGVYSHEPSAFQFPDVWGEFDTEFKIFKVFVTTVAVHFVIQWPRNNFNK